MNLLKNDGGGPRPRKCLWYSTSSGTSQKSN